MTGRSTTVLLICVALFSCGPGTGPGGSGGGKGGSGGTGGTGGSGGGGGGSVVCSRVNCAGCCNANQCEVGTDVALCGKDAVACAACGANQVCKADQSCGADPARDWRVYPSSAQISPSDNGTAWDSDGSAPDVQITMNCPASSGGVIGGAETESFSPGWATGGCVLKASQLLTEGIGWKADDLDVIGSDPIATFTTTAFTEADFIAGQKVVAMTGGITSITFRLAAP